MLKMLPAELFVKTNSGIEFSIYLVPGAKKEQILGVIDTDHGKILKIAIHERPIENKANVALIEFLSKIFKMPKSNISIKRGHKSREKRIEIISITIEHLQEVINKYISIEN